MTTKLRSLFLLTIVTLLSFSAMFVFPVAVSADQDTFSIIVETDDEQLVSGISVQCDVMNHEGGSKTVLSETTNEAGIAVFEKSESENVSYRCKTEQLITDDGCWYFPTPSQFFTSDQADQNPIYIIGLRTESTCETDVSKLSEDELAEMLLTGTPAPPQNLKAQPYFEPDYPELEKTNEEEAGRLEKLFEWFVSKIRGLFGLS